MISVITPTYNCAKYLLRSYECLRKQTYNDWEWIVVNDGSLDNTEEIILDLVKQDERVRYFSLDANYGRGYARYFAVSNCRGSAIAVWDVDDFYTSSRLQDIASAIASGYDFFCSYALVVDNNRNLKGARHFVKAERSFNSSFVHATLAFSSNVKGVVKYDKSMRAGEDLGVMLQLEKKYKGYFCEKYLLIYMEDREVNIEKAIDANVNQYRAILNALRKGFLDCSRFERFSFVVNKLIKISALRVLSFKPNWYLKTVKFRYREYIDSSKLTSEHISILGDVRK